MLHYIYIATMTWEEEKQRIDFEYGYDHNRNGDTATVEKEHYNVKLGQFYLDYLTTRTELIEGDD